MKKNKPTDVFKSINMHQGDQSICWEWTGSINEKDGRPYITINSKRRPSYAIVLELSSGKQQGNQVARHKCDNPICCNPKHLEWGTKQDNSNDMIERERHGLPKIVVRAIQNLLDDEIDHTTIANRYGISREAVTAINNSRTARSKKIDIDTDDNQ